MALRILLTNDDGVYAPGLAALRRELSRYGEVVVVAPATEQSGVGHAITIQTPLVVQEVYDGDTCIGWSVDGSPADCVKLACMELLDRPPDLVVSGVNAGSNVGINVLYSGTVAAAVEGAFFGITAFAISSEFAPHPDFAGAASHGVAVLRRILRDQPPAGLLFNINIPALHRGPPKGVRIVPQGVARYAERFERRVDPRGRTYFWAAVELVPGCDDRQTDIAAIADRYIAVTPLRFDLTNRTTLEVMRDWQWDDV